MAVRSRQLGYVRDPGINVITTLFTVPPERTAVVRRWSITNRSTDATRCCLQVRTGGVAVQMWRGTVAGGATVAEVDSNVVVNPGDSIEFFVLAGETTSAVHVIATGSLLDGAPS